MATANASKLLTESLASLSKSAYQAFAEVENQARSEVARATAEAREARIERDQAVEALHASQLEGQGWKQEVSSCKASLQQAEISIAHQKETLAQLRREANQWKDQSRNWQEHFLRVEQERCSLSTRIEELVAERLQWSRIPATVPITSTHHIVDVTEPASSSSAKRGSSSLNQPLAYKSAHPPSPPQVDSPSTSISAHKSNRSAPKPAKISKPKASSSSSGALPPYEATTLTQTPRTHKVSPRSPSHPEPRQTVIRRVQAVINVKQEESDEESGESEAKDELHEDEVAAQPSRSARRKRRIVPHDDDEYLSGDEMTRAIAEARGRDFSDRSDDDEDEHASDDEDDELMMGAEENHHELYGTRRIASSKKSSHSAGESLSASPNKKRKLAGPGGRDKPPVRRKN
ncbi:hypothetical protein Hypma_000831 [Hypsizygus marmoreus]|uniref:Uncharacterized protein n=1 Tax=Hypsizygus marmoreus TaxID=39966 RepID=A0A369JE75_HYPMA|nr:hypothetical protein Hypma_000831 [Hypsizygus marmoreus]